jgi:hypothetical protein
MIPTSHVYAACRDLFDAYPLAVSAVNHFSTMHSMVLMLPDGDDVRFFVLLRIRGEGRPVYTLSPWRADGAVEIAADGEVPDQAADAVTRGVPIPRDGSMFGWTCQEIVSALIVVFARYTPDSPTPAWSVMPLVGIPEAQWPPFTGERFFGPWFWEHHRAGNIIGLGGLIAANPGTVFWVDTFEALGSDCYVVACDIKTPEGHILRRGKYVDAAALQAGAVAPSRTDPLADASKTDLSPPVPGTGARDQLT